MVLERVAADDPRSHAFDDRLGREARLGELGDRFAPADHAVVGRDLDQAQVPERIEVVGLRVLTGIASTVATRLIASRPWR